MEERRALSTREVAQKYNVHPNTVRQMVYDGRLKAGRNGKDYRFSPDECDRVLLGIEPKAA